MLDDYLAREGVRMWLSEHRGRVAERHLTDVFHDFLLRVWGQSGANPDWRRLEAQELDIDRADLWEVVARSRLGSFAEGFLTFSADQPGVLAPMRDLVEGVEAISPPYPYGSLVCGAEATNEPAWTVDPTAFLGYNGMDKVFLVERVPPILVS